MISPNSHAAGDHSITRLGADLKAVDKDRRGEGASCARDTATSAASPTVAVALSKATLHDEPLHVRAILPAMPWDELDPEDTFFDCYDSDGGARENPAQGDEALSRWRDLMGHSLYLACLQWRKDNPLQSLLFAKVTLVSQNCPWRPQQI